MTSEGHFIFALASTILAKKMALTPALNDGDWWHVISGGLLTCLLPDLDHPKSLLGQRLTWLSAPISYIFGHRGFTHSLLAIIISAILLNLSFSSNNIIPCDAYHAMIVGYLSHIIADMLTPAGVPLFWPYRFRFYIPIFHNLNNIKLERLVCITLLIFALFYSNNTFLTNKITISEYILSEWHNIHNIYINLINNSINYKL